MLKGLRDAGVNLTGADLVVAGLAQAATVADQVRAAWAAPWAGP